MRAPRVQGSDLLDDVGQLIPRMRRRMWRLADASLAGHGLAMFEWQILKRLVRHGPLSQCQLAEMTAQHPAAVSRTLDELEARRLVRRTRDPDDRRRMRVAITRSGAARYHAVAPLLHRNLESAFAPLEPAELALLRDLLLRLVGPEEEPPTDARSRPAGGRGHRGGELIRGPGRAEGPPSSGDRGRGRRGVRPRAGASGRTPAGTAAGDRSEER